MKLSALRDFILQHESSLRLSDPEIDYTARSSEDAKFLGLLKEVFKEVAAMLSESNSRLLFVYHPPRVSTLFEVEDPHAAPILQAAMERGFAVLDLAVPLKNHPNPKSLYALHLNKRGYEFVGDIIGKTLRSLEESEKKRQ